jgi:regulatory protein
VRALATRDRSAHEIDTRLERAGVGEGDRVEAVAALAGLGYLDDARFAASRAATLAARGHGDASIRADLETRGIAPALIQAALAAVEPEEARARAMAGRDGRTPRTARRLSAKGFSPEAIEAALECVAPSDADLV